MKLAISNIAFPSYDHRYELRHLRKIGFDGLEVAPSKVWEDTWGVTPSQVKSYRRQIEKAGLKVVGLHSLFFDQPGLGLFRGVEVRKKTIKFLVHLSKICSDLGGRSLVFGSPKARQRKDLSVFAADVETISFFSELSEAIETHETFFVIEALSRNETDYIHSALHALEITKKVDRKELQCHLDAKAIVDSGEMNIDVFQKIGTMLSHFHANDPQLGILGESNKVDHALLGKLLKAIDYKGYVTAEQRLLNPNDPIKPIRKSYSVLKRCYK